MPTSFETLAQFNQPHLDRVSRSFAHGIRQLAPSLRAPVGLSYLICRILDTVEDAAWDEGENQTKAFERFDAFMRLEPSERAVREWAATFPMDLASAERTLLDDAPRVFREFHQLPETDKRVIVGPVLSMSRGMNHFMSRKRKTGALRLSSFAEVQSYCFFVAGVVGEVLTGLLKLRSNEVDERLNLTKAGRFGLFLQKVNILKDQWTDESENRFLVPSRKRLLRSLMNDAKEAMSYLEAVPLSESRYRVFCAWALLLGLASIPAIEKGYANHSVGKLPRTEALWLAHKIESRIGDTKALRGLFDELYVNAFDDRLELAVTEDAGQIPSELLDLYQGQMTEAELRGLLTSV